MRWLDISGKYTPVMPSFVQILKLKTSYVIVYPSEILRGFTYKANFIIIKLTLLYLLINFVSWIKSKNIKLFKKAISKSALRRQAKTAKLLTELRKILWWTFFPQNSICKVSMQQLDLTVMMCQRWYIWIDFYLLSRGVDNSSSYVIRLGLSTIILKCINQFL